MAEFYDEAAFALLQGRLAAMWPLDLRSSEPVTAVVVSSITAELPEHIYAVIPPYEERYLFYVLVVARAANCRVIYVTSQPIPQRIVNYYIDLMPGLSREEVRQRITFVSLSDWSPRPLVEKILGRPLLVERLRSLILDADRSVLMPFIVTEAEAQLALRLGIPVYGPDPALKDLGSKSGSREVFARAGVPMPRGVERLCSRADLVAAVTELQRSAPMAEAIVKLDSLGSGLGNASLHLQGASGRSELERRVDELQPEDESLDPEGFLALLEGGAVVEERLVGEDLASPSVQLRITPMDDVEVLSTHDQLLGGPSGQMFLGCTFPAEQGYRQLITRHARAVGAELARRGVVGRFGIDFITRRTATGGWDAHAIEVNLRNGGTTHPAVTLLAMTDGRYDDDSGNVVAAGKAKHYVASDDLEHPAYRALTPDDALDVLSEPGLGWDPDRLVGAVFHMTSAVAVAGRVGITAIGDSADEARSRYELAQAALDEAAEVPPELRNPPPW